MGPPQMIHDPRMASALEVYRSYCQVHVEPQDGPLGVAIDQHTLRGQLIFSEQPILLPHEFFVSVEHLQQSEAVRSEL